MEQKVIHVRINGYDGEKQKQTIKLFGKRYIISESAKTKYIIMTEFFTIGSVFAAMYMLYCIIWLFM